MTTSKDTIKYIAKNLKKENYVCLFVAGSIPEELIPQSDLDIFIVVKNDKTQEFFDDLTKIMNSFLKTRKRIEYSFFRGPLKYKNHALIHFITYLENETDKRTKGSPFSEEAFHVLKSLMSKYRLIKGKDPKTLLKNYDFNNNTIKEKHRTKSEGKYKILKKEGYIKYREWKKINGIWKFTYTKKYASKWLKNYLLSYYEKNLYNKNARKA